MVATRPPTLACGPLGRLLQVVGHRQQRPKWSKQQLLRLMESKTDSLTRNQLIQIFVSQQADRGYARIPEDQAICLVETLGQPLADGQGTASDRQVLRDALDLLFEFEEGPLEQQEAQDIEALGGHVPYGKQLKALPSQGTAALPSFEAPCDRQPTALPSQGASAQLSFEWLITDFSKQTTTLASPYHVLDGLRWKLEVEPQGMKAPSLSAHLLPPPDLPRGWRQRVEYSITLVNQLHGSRSVTNSAQAVFAADQGLGWGWNSFMALATLADLSKGWVVNDTLKLVASVKRLPD